MPGYVKWAQLNEVGTVVGERIKTSLVGSNPWKYIKLPTAFANSTTVSLPTPLFFLPEANSHYVIEGMLFVQAAATTTGAQVGLVWPSGTTQEAAWVVSPNSATAFASRFWGAPTSAKAAATGVAVANEGLFSEVKAMLVTGANPVGSFAITLASEVNLSEARIMQNSWIRYRKI